MPVYKYPSNYCIKKDLFEMRFSELQKLGADCIADIDHVDLLVAQRHVYLDVAKDLHLEDKLMAEAYCEMAEKLQDLIEFWGIN